MSYEDLENDIMKNKKYGFNALAFPFGCINKKIFKILEKHGYVISFSFGPSEYATRNSYRFSIPRIKILGNATVETLKIWLQNI